jgi:hypothetical protein
MRWYKEQLVSPFGEQDEKSSGGNGIHWSYSVVRQSPLPSLRNNTSIFHLKSNAKVSTHRWLTNILFIQLKIGPISAFQISPSFFFSIFYRLFFTFPPQGHVAPRLNPKTRFIPLHYVVGMEIGSMVSMEIIYMLPIKSRKYWKGNMNQNALDIAKGINGSLVSFIEHKGRSLIDLNQEKCALVRWLRVLWWQLSFCGPAWGDDHDAPPRGRPPGQSL